MQSHLVHKICPDLYLFYFISNIQSVVDPQGFSKDVCRSMVAMLDVDASGKLGFEEFKQLLTDIAKWKAVYKLYDHDNTGRLSAMDLREALNSAGYKLNNRILNALAHRYSGRDGMITFDDFIMCSVKLKTMMGKFSRNWVHSRLYRDLLYIVSDIFKERDLDGTNTASFSMQDWLEKTVYS